MLGSIARLFFILSRERPVKLMPGVRYRATLDLSKVHPGMQEADVRNWLMKIGFTPTSKPQDGRPRRATSAAFRRAASSRPRNFRRRDPSE
jgi:hypothetical protein